MALMLSLMEFAHAQSESTSSLFTVDTSYSVPDSDNDGMSDEWELANGLNPNSNDSGQDIDGDGFTNLEEFNNGTHPKFSNSIQLSESLSELFVVDTSYSVPDSDNDGMSDEWELANGLNPNSNDSGQDIDGDGFTNLEEFNNGTHPKLTNSTQLSESFSDLFKVNTTGSKLDTDKDGIPDRSGKSLSGYNHHFQSSWHPYWSGGVCRTP